MEKLNDKMKLNPIKLEYMKNKGIFSKYPYHNLDLSTSQINVKLKSSRPII